MSNVPRLCYFAENETAESATKNFALILQKAFEQYRKLWDKYLDLVKKYEVNSPAGEEIQEMWKKENILKSMQVLPENIDFFNKSMTQAKPWEKEKEMYDRKQNENVIEDILKEYKLDFDSDIDDTIYQTPHKETNIILPESPIFTRTDGKRLSKNESFTANNNKTSPLTIETVDDTFDFNEQHDDGSVISDKKISDVSFSNISPVIICNTPIVTNECNKKNRKKLLKKTCEYKQQLKDNSVSPEKQQVRETKTILQAVENVTFPSKASLNYNQDKTRFKSFAHYKHSMVSPDSKKLRQTRLPFYTIKNKVDNAIVKPTDKNIPINKAKKFIFNYESYTESTPNQNETTSDKNNDTTYIGDANNENEMICEDVVQNSPDSLYVGPQNETPLKLKRKFPETDNAEYSYEDTKSNMEKSLKISEDAQLEQEPTKKNCIYRVTRIASIEQQDSSLLDVFQSENEDETCIEDHIEKENIMNVNKKSSIHNVSYTSPTQETLIDTHELRNPKENIKCIGKLTVAAKGARTRTKEGWSCWECAEYYKNKPGVSEKCVQKWRNQCSRHRNIYYAREGTPPGFWDPLFPPTAPDSIQED
ncbi:hypothetical protein KPH14_008207 [Odynerus spinipes]|uniref:DNA endonuclease activator Ctp1 C-terminal domain-containing protein n=1 Tax=Odynerus spinipes TaxID=1348599 RepID=A0AAD9VLJ9_9HYME|nr:hypothetical protein KPH14_008207 [Odynerus spinipes]